MEDASNYFIEVLKNKFLYYEFHDLIKFSSVCRQYIIY